MNSNLAVSRLACMRVDCMRELTSKRLQDMLQNCVVKLQNVAQNCVEMCINQHFAHTKKQVVAHHNCFNELNE